MTETRTYLNTIVAETCSLGNRYLRIGDDVDPTTLKVVSNQRQSAIFQGLKGSALDIRTSGGTIDNPNPIEDLNTIINAVRFQSWNGGKFDDRVRLHTINSSNFNPKSPHPATDLVISTAYNDYFNHFTFRDDGVFQSAGIQPMTYINNGSYLGEHLSPHNNLPEPLPDTGNPMYGTIIFDAGKNKLKCFVPNNANTGTSGYTDIQMGDPVVRSYTSANRPTRSVFIGTISDRILTVTEVRTGFLRFGLPIDKGVNILNQLSGEVGRNGTYLLNISNTIAEDTIFEGPAIPTGTLIYNSEHDHFEGWNGRVWKVLG